MSYTASLQFKKSSRLPVILQDEVAECGHACVAMISNFWGHELDLRAIRRISRPSQRGVTLLTLKEMFENLGFITRPLRVSLEELRQIKTPAIIHWNMNHFVVLKKVSRHSITIHDPAIGLKHCSMDEVFKSFTGIVLEVEKTDHFQKIRDCAKLSLYDLVQNVSGINKSMILLILLSFSIEILHLLNPLFIQYVTDDVIGSSEIDNLYIIASAFIILILIQIFTEYIRGHLIIYLTNNLTEKFSANVVNHLLKLPLDFLKKGIKAIFSQNFILLIKFKRKSVQTSLMQYSMGLC